MKLKARPDRKKGAAVRVQRIVSQPDIMERTRAAGCWLNGRRSRRTGDVPKDESMAAFMAIFHPEIKCKKLKALVG